MITTINLVEKLETKEKEFEKFSKDMNNFTNEQIYKRDKRIKELEDKLSCLPELLKLSKQGGKRFSETARDRFFSCCCP